ncbi:aspartate-semialdehyde dehydrogenase [Phaeobacter sp. HS012]|uniref:aspartate-semialdehyde dehydrogenase n=1 Tax=unclassified Phaeobacter TaxID=2621772 RepID=UPI001B396219|nr:MULTISPECIES: aspartate-semialdehyde dehydrogenase [unclassified Phaeobacter]MBQ4806136.1 aspartate-semialdehyde dehydrogenase [Phaeobacter sp. HS012]MBQ4880986.1 aspartate-semialdehyde dehydrogenase [Phaeobacter sp. HS011]
MTTAKKNNPELWQEVKKEITQSDKGGEPGEWSARKAQLAVQMYKRRGGTYADKGPDQDETDLNQWSEEDWGTKSGAKSSDTGERYLPKDVRMVLTEDEYRRSTAKKQSDTHDGSEQFSDQPDDVQDKVAQIMETGPTYDMLYERAQDLGIDGRSEMSKEDLLNAIRQSTDDNGRAKGSKAALNARSKSELYQRAKDRDVSGRSEMCKSELVDALAKP